MSSSLTSCAELKVTLFDGKTMPQVGLGTWMGRNPITEEVSNAVSYALKHGYTLVDTARIYQDEKEVGKGIKDSGVARDKIWVTTKVWNTHHAADKVKESCEESLKCLGLTYLDLLLIHWPYSDSGVPIKETWQAMEKLVDEGKVKYIGLSNFSKHRVEEVIGFARIPVAVNQVELHPWLQQQELVDFLKEKKIVAQAYMPFGNLNRFFEQESPLLIESPELVAIAKEVGMSTNELCVSWAVTRGTATIPKSVKPARIDSNFKYSKLSDEVMKKIGKLDKSMRFCNPLEKDWKEKW